MTVVFTAVFWETGSCQRAPVSSSLPRSAAHSAGVKTQRSPVLQPSFTSSFGSLSFSPLIMAALKHYQPCLQIWNPKVSDLPVYYLHRLHPLHPHWSFAGGHILCLLCDRQISRLGSFIIIIRGNFWECCVGDAASFSLSVYLENNPN